MNVKEITWIGTALEDLRSFPGEAKSQAGYQLRRVQSGLQPNDYKPMPTIGSGVFEVRIHEEGEFRVFYIAKFAEGIYVLHAFQKKTQKTAIKDIELGRNRMKEALQMRREL